MYRSSILLFLLITILMISFTNGKNITDQKQQQPSISTHKPVSIKICGLALIRMLDMVCTKARQLLMKNGILSSSSPPQAKRQFNIEDDPYSRTVSVTDYSQFNDTLVGDCCLQACTLKILLKYC
ncbi:unnamed protein product [Adineta steineri]|uniref:Insulin-like domain-containing protein n=1 Tax=Adineta steineri TaxID=433720 RepID=A0A813RZT7_9BILA|nr:unnamed protein product [Adineta steineri]CAF1245036.1 unnamed protein product [Adineta steineri]